MRVLFVNPSKKNLSYSYTWEKFDPRTNTREPRRGSVSLPSDSTTTINFECERDFSTFIGHNSASLYQNGVVYRKI